MELLSQTNAKLNSKMLRTKNSLMPSLGSRNLPRKKAIESREISLKKNKNWAFRVLLTAQVPISLCDKCIGIEFNH